MHIQLTSNGNSTVFKINNSPAAKALYDQLPMSINVEDYGSNEKIFYPPRKLDISGTPGANAKAGTLAYYAPWGDVVMFYKEFGSASGLYELGQDGSGRESIYGICPVRYRLIKKMIYKPRLPLSNRNAIESVFPRTHRR